MRRATNDSANEGDDEDTTSFQSEYDKEVTGYARIQTQNVTNQEREDPKENLYKIRKNLQSDNEQNYDKNKIRNNTYIFESQNRISLIKIP